MHIWDSMFKPISGPIVNLRLQVGSLPKSIKVCTQHTGDVSCKEDKDMPEAVEIREVNREPVGAVDSVTEPYCHGNHHPE